MKTRFCTQNCVAIGVDARARQQRSNKMKAFILAAALISPLSAVAMAQSTFPNFDYQKECEKWASPQMKQWKAIVPSGRNGQSLH